jgi:hypothetical protein
MRRDIGLLGHPFEATGYTQHHLSSFSWYIEVLYFDFSYFTFIF